MDKCYLDQSLIDLALSEDLGNPYQDLTTATLFSKSSQQKVYAKILLKQTESVVLCGLPVVSAILAKLNETCEIQSSYLDGDSITGQATVLSIVGPVAPLLMAERTLLNFLQHLSAVATMTRHFVDKVKHTKARILDTRKTLPGFRHLDKYAVTCGGGVNHRKGLYDAVMIKDTHVDLLGNMAKALDKLPEEMASRVSVIVEVRNQKELETVLEKGLQKITRVLLDNMTLVQIKACVAMCQGILPVEVSGNVQLDNVAAIAETGVDFISVGKLTHSAGSVDFSMQCDNNA